MQEGARLQRCLRYVQRLYVRKFLHTFFAVTLTVLGCIKIHGLCILRVHRLEKGRMPVKFPLLHTAH